MKKPTKKEYIKAYEKLQKSGSDKIGKVGTAAVTGIGGAAGYFIAPTAASYAGATTLLGSTKLAGWLGGIFVTTTPTGWIVGGIAIGVGLAYGVCKLVKSGAKADTKKKNNISVLKTKINS